MSLRDEISKLTKEKRASLDAEDDRLEERFRLIKRQIAEIHPALDEISKSVEGSIVRFETRECWAGIDTIVVLVSVGDIRFEGSSYDRPELDDLLNTTGNRGGIWYFYPFFPPDGGEYWVLGTQALGYKNKKRFDTPTELLADLVPQIAECVARMQHKGFVFR